MGIKAVAKVTNTMNDPDEMMLMLRNAREELEGVDMDSQPASPASRMPSTEGKLAEMRASMTGALRVAASHNETAKLSVV